MLKDKLASAKNLSESGEQQGDVGKDRTYFVTTPGGILSSSEISGSAGASMLETTGLYGACVRAISHQ